MSGATMTADDLLGSLSQTSPSQGQPVSADDLLSSVTTPSPKPAMGGDFWDHYFSQAPNIGDTLTGIHVLSDFGQGFINNWGAVSAQMTAERDEAMKPFLGPVNDVHASIGKAFNEAIVRPAAFGVINTLKAAEEAFIGIPSGVVGGLENIPVKAGERAETTPIGAAIHAKQLGETIGGGIEEAAEGALLPMGIPPMGVAELDQARNLGIIGKDALIEPEVESPAGPSGPAAAVSQETAAIRGQVEKQTQEAKGVEAPQDPTTTPGASGAATVAQEATPPDIHAVARQIAPETFQEYDALSARKDAYRQWLTEMDAKREQDAYAEHADEIDNLNGKIADPDTTPRLVKKYQARLDNIQDSIDQAIQGDSPQMARIRQELQTADYRQRDLVPEVAAAYRKARAQLPEEAAGGNVTDNLTVTRETNEGSQTNPEALPPEQTAQGKPVQPMPESAASRTENVPGVPRIVPAEMAGEGEAGTLASEGNRLGAPAGDIQPKLKPSVEKTMAGIHGVDAEITPPHHAAEVADHIRTEIDQSAKNLSPEIHDGLPHKAGSEIAGIAGENEVPASGRNETGPAAGTARGASEPSGIAGGGNAVEAEGANLRAEPGAGGGIAAGEHRGTTTTRLRGGALRPIEGTGEERERAINGATYNVGEEAPQKEAAQKLVDTDYDRAISVALRQKQPPPGVHPEFVYMAVEDKATRDGDVALIEKLKNSRIAEEATTMGQRIGAWKNRDPLSAVAQVQEVENAKAAAAESRDERNGGSQAVQAKEEKNIVQAVSKARKAERATKPPAWTTFIDSITCAGE